MFRFETGTRRGRARETMMVVLGEIREDKKQELVIPTIIE